MYDTSSYIQNTETECIHIMTSDNNVHDKLALHTGCVCMKSAIIDLIMLVGRISITYWIFVVPHFTMENNNNDDDKKRPFILFYTIMSLFFCSRYFVLHILNMNIFTLQKRRKWVVVLLMVLQILTRYTCNNESISILFGRKLVQNILMII